MVGGGLDGFRSFQDVRSYHTLERLEPTVESTASLAGAVLQISKQALAPSSETSVFFYDRSEFGGRARKVSVVCAYRLKQ